jgi:hypothetical protein
VYPLLLVYLDCPLSLPLRCSLTCICPASYVSYAASFSGLSLCIVLYVLFNLYLSCVLLTLCCQVFWIVPFIAPSVFSNIYMSCVLCSLCCQSGQINDREYRRGNEKGQSRETGKIGYTRQRTNTC